MAVGSLLEVTVHVDRSLGLSNVKSLKAGTTVAELKEELARDDPTGSLRPQDFVLGCGGSKLRDAQRITEEFVDLDLWTEEVAEEPVVEAEATAPPAVMSTALALAPAPAVVPAPVEDAQKAVPAPAASLAAAEAAASPAVAATAPAEDAEPALPGMAHLLAQLDGEAAGDAVAAASDGTDWVRYKTADGKAYFHDATSGKTQWDEPARWREPEEPKAPAAEEKAQWIRYQDAEGKAYFHDAVSGRTQWEEPLEWRDPDQAAPAFDAARVAAAVAARAAAAAPEEGQDGEAAKSEVKACAHPLCKYRVHSNIGVSTSHCCRICKNTPHEKEPQHGGRCERWSVDAEQPERPAPTQAPAPAPAPVATGVADENSIRKLFESMDRGGNGQVSKRDVLVALRKHPPVRRLFGLPVTNVEPGGDALEARLLAIQDSFEAGSGLGELAPAFDQLREGSEGGGQTFGIEAFLASCRTGPLRAGARNAATLLPREHATGAAFVPTHEWVEVPGDAVCPGGLEYKMDMSTGKTLARLPLGTKAAVER